MYIYKDTEKDETKKRKKINKLWKKGIYIVSYPKFSIVHVVVNVVVASVTSDYRIVIVTWISPVKPCW